MRILHVSAECFPAAKIGGLADVVGSLPKFQCRKGMDASVIMPKYGTAWFAQQSFTTVYQNQFWYPGQTINFTIEELDDPNFEFQLYVIDIPGKFDRDSIYGHDDDEERWMSFQRSVLLWLTSVPKLPEILHVHDHHTGIIPFMLRHCYDFKSLQEVKTVYTVHNLQYQGSFGWDMQFLLPSFDNWKSGLLDWDNHINPMASALRCADAITTVSPTYLEELKINSDGLEWIFETESDKCTGILNGIDYTIWDPKTDPLLKYHLASSISDFKVKNKNSLAARLDINPECCTIGFIGRLVSQKGADLLTYAMHHILSRHNNVNFVILGTGDPYLEDQFLQLKNQYPSITGITLAYDEELAHHIYAACDYLIMPSRFEPCGLNQMYAMRYGTIPIVNNTGRFMIIQVLLIKSLTIV